MSTEDTITSWSERVAGLGVDMLVDHGLIKKRTLSARRASLPRRFEYVSPMAIIHRQKRMNDDEV
jgi:hypothetical protein